MIAALADNVERVRAGIRAACERSGRDPAEVVLVAVTKTVGVETAGALPGLGVSAIGENRVGELLRKMEALEGGGIDWHLVGPLQRNKVPKLLREGIPPVTIHSVDSERLAETIDARVESAGLPPVAVFLEVNVAGETAKHGVSPEAVPALAARIRELPGLRLDGLMGMPPVAADPEGSRPHFRRLKALASDLGLGRLSMGMTQDYAVAVEEGATHVRIGRGLFHGVREADAA